MHKHVIRLLTIQVVKNAFSNRAIQVLGSIVIALLLYAAVSGYQVYKKDTISRLSFQKEVREHWEEMPDKHPHRMAHYGYLVFRHKQPLSFFDFGIESYTGNAIFLEAHRQNSTNFSQAGFSTGLLRFGEISMAMVLQILVPLVIFFIGFNLVAADRENGTLKLLLTQGASWKDILIGRSLGLSIVSFGMLLPAIIMLVIALLFAPGVSFGQAAVPVLFVAFSYTVYLCIISTIAVLISAVSKQAKTALITLIGIWLLLAILLPRVTQAIGNYVFPTPSKIAFETAIEIDLIKQGDSHDPNDTHYKQLKDSVLKANKVSSVEDLSFNYGGFQMKEGERISAELYNKHLADLQERYQLQNRIARLAAFINPFAAVRNLSMTLSGTDFNTYTQFQQQAEAYRYQLAQHMNDLQIELISNKKLADTARPYTIDKTHWKAFPDFAFQSVSNQKALSTEALSIAALLFWPILLSILIHLLSKKLKAI